MTPEQRRRWQELVEVRRRLALTLAELKVPEVLPIVKAVLGAGGPGLDTALRLAQGLPDEQQMELFPQLYRAAIAPHDHTELARQVLGQLDSGWLAFALGSEVQRTLKEGDRDTRKRLETLLAALGQEDLLGRVVETSAQAEGEVTREGTHQPETHRVENAVSPSPGGRPSPDLTPEQERYWARVLEAESAAIAARTSFTPEDSVAVLREALVDDADREAALGFAQHLPDEQLKELLPQLYETATITHRSILLTRRLIARLDRQWLTSALGPLVERTLAEGDEEAYRRLAELLDHLEQYGLLARLVEAAAGSEDEEIREVAEDFSRGIPSRN